MRENRTYGSEGGEGFNPFPTPIERSGVTYAYFCKQVRPESQLER
jgi:hypothetical protein